MDERKQVARFEELGESQVRQMALQWQGPIQRAAFEWLKKKDKESESRNESAQTLQATGVSRAADAAERQALAAEKANTRATIALLIAVASITINAIMAYWLATRPAPSVSPSHAISAVPQSSHAQGHRTL